MITMIPAERIERRIYLKEKSDIDMSSYSVYTNRDEAP